LRAAIADHPFRLPGQDIAITVSIGICATESARPVPFDLMLKQADTALYTAKALGRNRAEIQSYDLPA
jgi:diguanylate cyclase (GGDEF)-like protein